MGILNVTPDSFYDGGKYVIPEVAVEQALRLINEGADIIDIGGESTRPGSKEVPGDEELARVIPVIKLIREKSDIQISIDTRKAVVADAAIKFGATMVNDVSALLYDPLMADLVAATGVDVVLMHSQGNPENMQDDPRYDDVIDEINSFFAERLEFSTSKGIDESKITVDPGIGFGKTIEHNLEIIRRLDEFQAHGVPVLLGPSNKSFIGHTLGGTMDDRSIGTVAVCVFAVIKGAKILRVHDVGSVVKAVRMTEAIIEKTGAG